MTTPATLESGLVYQIESTSAQTIVQQASWMGRAVSWAKNKIPESVRNLVPASFSARPIVCGLGIPFAALGLGGGIAGAVLYSQNKDPDMPDFDPTLKLAGLILLCVGWPLCCCGGSAPVIVERVQARRAE